MDVSVKKPRSRIRDAHSDRFFQAGVSVLGVLTLLIVLLPLLYVVSASFSAPEAIIKNEVWLLPKGFNINAYKNVFRNMDILTGYRNTIFYACVGTVINILMTIALAYPLSRRDFRGRGILTALCTVTMFFSGGMIPTFLVIKDIGLYNTVWVMMIPKCISVWNMFLLRNYFQHSVPEELIESARVDGASEWRPYGKSSCPFRNPFWRCWLSFMWSDIGTPISMRCSIWRIGSSSRYR